MLGPDVALQPRRRSTRCNHHVVPARIIREIAARGSKALIGLVGVQSNQFHHALDLAREFRAAGLPVVIGGFHVSGCLSMLQGDPARDPGGARHRLLALRRRMRGGAARRGAARRLARRAASRSTITSRTCRASPACPCRGCPRSRCERNCGQWSSFDLGRGCPFQCSFCTIINVQGRKSRFRTADDLEAIIRENLAQGIKAFFITDDNLARNKDWESLLRPADQAARGGRAEGQSHHPGRHALPPHPELHRQGEARRRDAGVHRPREHQPRQSARRQQAPEQDHRISADASAMARARRLHLRRLHPRLPRRHARNRSCATSRSSSASCRSTCSNSSS